MFPKSIRILVVDDMKTMRMVVKKNLKNLGYENIAEADDGETAWPKIEEALGAGEPFDLILSDWNMPKLKGIDLLKMVRENPRLKKTPFILVTAESEKHQIVHAVKLGVSNYLVKPFTEADLREKLEQAALKKSA